MNFRRIALYGLTTLQLGIFPATASTVFSKTNKPIAESIVSSQDERWGRVKDALAKAKEELGKEGLEGILENLGTAYLYIAASIEKKPGETARMVIENDPSLKLLAAGITQLRSIMEGKSGANPNDVLSDAIVSADNRATTLPERKADDKGKEKERVAKEKADKEKLDADKKAKEDTDKLDKEKLDAEKKSKEEKDAADKKAKDEKVKEDADKLAKEKKTKKDKSNGEDKQDPAAKINKETADLRKKLEDNQGKFTAVSELEAINAELGRIISRAEDAGLEVNDSKLGPLYKILNSEYARLTEQKKEQPEKEKKAPTDKKDIRQPIKGEDKGEQKENITPEQKKENVQPKNKKKVLKGEEDGEQKESIEKKEENTITPEQDDRKEQPTDNTQDQPTPHFKNGKTPLQSEDSDLNAVEIQKKLPKFDEAYKEFETLFNGVNLSDATLDKQLLETANELIAVANGFGYVNGEGKNDNWRKDQLKVLTEQKSQIETALGAMNK